jgi:probable HAF family extracellular repeat protein
VWSDGILTDLGVLPGGNNSNTTWISDNGLVVGDSENGLVDPSSGLSEADAVLWKDGNISNLGTVQGGTQSLATTVNSGGQIAGFSNNDISDPFSLAGFSTQTRAFIFQHGSMTDLGTLGGPDALSAFINERGQIAGLSYTTSTPNSTTGIPTLDPFLWEDGIMLDLGTLGGTIGFPGGLNSRGQVIGNSDLAGDSTFHPFLWSRGKLQDLGTLGGNDGYANWINDAGDVVGEANIPVPCTACAGPGNQEYHAYLWSEGRMTDLGTVPGDKCSVAFAINHASQVVGASGICHGSLHAFLWENGGPAVDVNTLVFPKSDMNVIYPFDINDRGEIAAQAVLPNGDIHAVLLVPDRDLRSRVPNQH